MIIFMLNRGRLSYLPNAMLGWLEIGKIFEQLNSRAKRNDYCLCGFVCQLISLVTSQTICKQKMGTNSLIVYYYTFYWRGKAVPDIINAIKIIVYFVIIGKRQRSISKSEERRTKYAYQRHLVTHVVCTGEELSGSLSLITILIAYGGPGSHGGILAVTD